MLISSAHGGGGGGGGGDSSIVVAAADAPADIKARADFVCTGVNDNLKIDAAIAAADTGFFNGKSVTLSAGSYYFGDDVVTAGDLVAIQGSGHGNQGVAKHTTIYSASGYAGSLFTLNGGAELYLSDLYLVTDDAGPSGTTGLIMCDASAGGSNVFVGTNIYVENDFGVGIVSHAATLQRNTIYLDNCDIEGDAGGLLGNYLTKLYAQNTQFFAYSTGYALDINESAQNNAHNILDHCYFEGLGGMRFVVQSGAGSVEARNCFWSGFDGLPALYVGNANHTVSPNVMTGTCAGDPGTATDLVTFSACAHLTYELNGICSGGHGLHLASCNDTQGSFMILDPSRATDNTYSGVILDGTGARNTVGPVHVRSTAANKALYGVRVGASTVTATHIHGASLVGSSKTAGNEVSDLGTGTVFGGSKTLTLAQAGTLATGAGVGRARIENDSIILGAEANVNTAPTGSSVLVDINKNGTTIYTTQASRVAIAASANSGAQAAAPDVKAASKGDYITADIDQIGSTIAGADLVVNVRYLPI